MKNNKNRCYSLNEEKDFFSINDEIIDKNFETRILRRNSTELKKKIEEDKRSDFSKNFIENSLISDKKIRLKLSSKNFETITSGKNVNLDSYDLINSKEIDQLLNETPK